jgi:NADH:ubiquinone oxidoreductase subunit 6 (subunit J)
VPSPRDADAVRPVIVGTVIAALTFVVLLTQRAWLDERDAQWWIGAAGAATVLGLIGIVLVTRRATR